MGPIGPIRLTTTIHCPAMPAPTDADARAILRNSPAADDQLTRLGNAGGFSGATLWRVTGKMHDSCLKALPAGADPARHGRIAELLLWTKQQHDLNYVPRPRFVHQDAGRVWEMVEWMPGTADFHANPSAERLRAACVALARLHRVWEQYPGRRTDTWPCPGVVRRLQIAHDFRKLVTSGWRPVFAADPLAPWGERAWAVARRGVPAVIDELESWLRASVPVQFCVCDVWHDHVLFTGDTVTGLIDYGGVKLDNVAVDLARLLGSLVGNDSQALARGLAAYEQVRPLSADERNLVPILDRTGVVLGIVNWLRWVYFDGRVFEDRDAVARRLAALVTRAE
jgi:Ser/Thr protein kinase RdoA (MazF antagonist)